jgi:antitoxin component YwqK of YwqJK toxin-antitoxin module
MKTPITFLLSLTFLFLFSGSVYGDEEVEKKYWDNGKLMYVLPFKNGKEDGVVTEWYKSGKKKFIGHLKNRIENGIRKEWDEDGKLKFEGNFVNGVEEIK